MDTRPISVDQFQGRTVMFDQTKSYALLLKDFFERTLNDFVLLDRVVLYLNLW